MYILKEIFLIFIHNPYRCQQPLCLTRNNNRSRKQSLFWKIVPYGHSFSKEYPRKPMRIIYFWPFAKLVIIHFLYFHLISVLYFLCRLISIPIWCFIPTLAWDWSISIFWPWLGGLLISDLQRFLRGYDNSSNNQIWHKFTLMQSRCLMCTGRKGKHLSTLQGYGQRKWWNNNFPRLCNKLLNFLYMSMLSMNE